MGIMEQYANTWNHIVQYERNVDIWNNIAYYENASKHIESYCTAWTTLQHIK